MESIRTPHGPRQKLLLNLGFLDLPKDKWKELANTIESELHKQKRLFTTDPKIETLAGHYSKVIIKEQLHHAQSNKTDYNLPPLYEKVDIHLRLFTTMHCTGSPVYCWNIMKQLRKSYPGQQEGFLI